MDTQPGSIWMTGHAEAGEVAYPALSAATLDVDVVVVGGGITGVTTALMLAEAGRSVALLEAARIGASNTGRSTGNLYGTLSSGLAKVRAKWGDEVLREVVAMRSAAVDRIGQNVARLGIDCAFERRALYCGVAGDGAAALQSLEEEFDAASAAGLAPEWVEAGALPVPFHRVLRIDRQAQFNPWRYTRALASALAGHGAHVHEHSAVTDIDAGDGIVRTRTGEVRARHIVLATHTPKGFNLVQAEMEAQREYGVAAPMQGAPDGIFWVRDRSRSVRSYRHDGRDYLVVVGEKHKTGEHEPGADYYQRLRDYARAQFGVEEFSHEWSAQQYHAADELPYVGPSAHGNVFIATGFAADGLTWGTVAAAVLCDLVQGRETAVAERLSARRFTPAKSARGWATENTTVVKHLVGDRFAHAELERLSQVRPGEGRIVDLDGRKHAVYRSPEGELTVLSPVCPHLKCLVAWNPAATSWDCPCHGSRFGVDGRVLEGPSLHPLEHLVIG